ncbi:MAG TPA: hypothetical protein VF676_04410 [Flavobacterium sp.]|jgi:hypothetical protein
MKTFPIFFLLLASSLCCKSYACGFYPYGEEIRYCFFRPDNFGYNTFSEFNYSSALFDPTDVYRAGDIVPNDKLWFEYCRGKVSFDEIKEAVYSLPAEQINVRSQNEMIRYLIGAKDTEAIYYLKFAKTCEYFNTLMDDPWERNELLVLPKRAKMIDNAVRLSGQVYSRQLKLRYLFLAIRLAYYNGNAARIRSLYDKVYKLTNDDSILNYFSLYFRTLAETDISLASFYAAQVFANAPEKRFMIYSKFDTGIEIGSVLKYAKNDVERANVYLLAAVRKPDRALDYLRHAYKYDPQSEGTAFLLLREINKIEDWVLTPYYSMFSSSIALYNQDGPRSVTAILNRVEQDRVYASQVLQFAKRVKYTSPKNTLLLKAGIAHLQFITRNYSSSIAGINELERSVDKGDSIYNQLQIIKALSLVAGQKRGSATVPDEIRGIILANKHDKKFLFALGRELEFKDNFTDAALLYSKLQDNGQYSYVAWKTKKNNAHSYMDYFDNYFSYVDVCYTVTQIEDLIADVLANRPEDDFSTWMYSTTKDELSKIYDLLGTKYIRLDNLHKALENFNKVGKKHWLDNYSVWEKSEYNGNIFDENPFFVIKYTPDFITPKENFIANKATVTRRLIHYLRKANDKNENDRDYYYFLVANCYYNMTINGNSWMMRRFGYSNYDVDPFPVDEYEFRHGILAEKYYMKAYKYSKNKRFAALCLRLANQPYKLKAEFPDDYHSLYNGCTYFADYFKARGAAMK